MSMTLEERIAQYKESEKANKELAKKCMTALAKAENRYKAEECRQMIEWLKELAERRKADSCKGCKNISLWENEYENGVSCPCLRCARRAEDNYEPERGNDANNNLHV